MRKTPKLTKAQRKAMEAYRSKPNTTEWYENTLLKYWLETGNYSEISRRTHIPRQHISKVCKRALKHLLETY